MNQSDYHFDEVRGSLSFSESKIELELHKDDIFTGSFYIEEQDGLDMEGHVCSSNIRMRANMPGFSGHEAQIEYTFDSTGMQVGDVLKGNLNIVTNRGEFVLPFVVMIQRENIDSSMGVIKNLFHFTNLAKSNWNEAVSVFYHPNFEENLTGNDAKYKNLYRGLTSKGNRNFNLEEFLIGINKKQRIEYELETESIKLSNPTANQMKEIKLFRSGWGYTMIAIKTDCEFIVLPQNRLSNDDFDDDVCVFEFEVDTDKLHDGKNSGKITFRSLYDELSVEVEITKNSFAKKTGLAIKKRNAYALTRYYLDYTVKRINLSKWLVMTDEILGVKSDDEDDIASALITVHSLLLQQKYNEAKFILDKKVRSKIEEANNELYCYYLYMNALYSGDNQYYRDMARQIDSIYNNDKYNWRIAWIIGRMADDYNKSASKRYSFAMDQVRLGCISPVIYLEAIKALSEEPALLMRLEEEEKRVLLFAAREGVLTKDICEQVSYLVIKSKTFDKKLYRIMRYIYDKTGSDEALEAICVQLIKGGCVGEQYLVYYKEAVDRNFPLTRLYESYMMSLDLNIDYEIPKRVLMYFSLQSSLPEKQNAYLYAYVVRNREENTQIYMSFKESIDRFIIKELYAGKVDRNLAYLYNNILLEELLTKDNIKQLGKVLFVHRITVEDRRCVNVIVIDNRLKEEQVFPIVNGCANIVLLCNEYTLLLEDEIGNRFYATKEYQIEKFFMPSKAIARMDHDSTVGLEYNLYLCEDNPEFLICSAQNEPRYKALERDESVSQTYRGKIRLPLIRYYQEIDDTEAIDEIVSNISYEDVSYKDCNELIRIVLIRGLTKKAYDYAMYYGIDSIEPKTLVRLANQIMAMDNDEISEGALVYILMSAFERGKYDVDGISFLVKAFRGPIKMLRNVWKAANDFDVDTYDICEKIILQMLATGAYIGEEADVLHQYVEGGGKLELILQYLTYFAHEYFVKGRPVDEYIFYLMERMYRVEGELPESCMLAWLQYMSEKIDTDDINEKQQNTISELVRFLAIKKGIKFPFFKRFKNICATAARLNDYCMVEYRGMPGAKTVINYVISKDGEEMGGYSREDMTEMYSGIFIKPFLLFFGETLQYYITEEIDGVPQFTESKTVCINETLGDSNADRYTMVNDVAVADTLKDYDTTIRLLEEYKKKEYLVEYVFSPQ